MAMKEPLWDGLIESLQLGKCVLVLGPDIPARRTGVDDGEPPADISLRDVFCGDLTAQLEQESQKVGERSLFAVAQQYDDSPAFSTVNLKNFAAKFFKQAKGYAPGPLHLELARCPFSLVLTTSHDDLFARALRGEASKSPSRYWYHYRGEPRDNRELDGTSDPSSPAIYHLFGTFEEPNSMVLTENDLLEFVSAVISARPKLPESLRTALRNKTFLFIGFGIRHWYIRVLLKLLMRALELAGGSVAIESLGELDPREKEQTVMFYKRGTRVEVVDMDALEFVRDLLDRLERSGGYSGPTQRRIRRARVFISYERSDATYAQRLHEGLPRDQFDPWLDSSLLQGGDDWNAELEEKLQSSDYFLVLNSQNLASKQVGYVNKEITLALDRQRYRQSGIRFIIPLQVGEITTETGLRALAPFQQLPLRLDSFPDDLGVIVKTMSRDFQLRIR
jgi:SIR2-like protein/TIR domain-containing protein